MMTDPATPREVEIKLEVDPADASRLAELPVFSGEGEHLRQISVYFDTPKSKLRRNGWVLRVRQTDGRFIQTIKRSGRSPIPVEREEWEEEVGGLKPDLKAIARTPLADLVKRRQFVQQRQTPWADGVAKVRGHVRGRGAVLPRRLEQVGPFVDPGQFGRFKMRPAALLRRAHCLARVHSAWLRRRLRSQPFPFDPQQNQFPLDGSFHAVQPLRNLPVRVAC